MSNFNPKEMTTVGTKEVSLFFGSFQPLNKYQVDTIKKMRDGVIVVVKNNRDEINHDQQIKMLKKVLPTVEIVVIKNENLPEAVDTLHMANRETVKVYATHEKLKTFKKQVDDINKKLEDDFKIDVSYELSEKSSTEHVVRDAIRKKDQTTFEKHMPKQLWDMWGDFVKQLNEEKTIPVSFHQYLQEDGVNVSGGIAQAPMPLSPVQRRKALEEDGSLDIPNLDKCKNKMRHGMPQISDWDKFVEAVKENGGKITDKEYTPNDLTPSQKNFKAEKVLGLMGKDDVKPIVVSKDGFVLDGHHRWLASHHSDTKVKCSEVSLDFDEILELCDGASFIEKKTINENEDII